MMNLELTLSKCDTIAYDDELRITLSMVISSGWNNTCNVLAVSLIPFFTSCHGAIP